jgi:hypothetical protein
MDKRALAGVIVFLLLAGGCAQVGETYRKTLLDLAAEDTLNAEAMRTVADQIRLTWAINSGAIRTALDLQVNPNMIPPNVYLALDRLDTLSRMTEAEYAAMSDFDRDFSRGAAVALRIILAIEVVKKIIQIAAPQMALMAGI